MKKDRNCGMPSYPVYPGMMTMQQPGMMPIGPMPQMPGNFNMNPTYVSQQGTSSSSIEQQLSNLNSQVNSLERRIVSLESLVGSPTSKYNNSNYQVM